MDDEGIPLARRLARLLCRVGLHDFRIVEVSVGFGDGTGVVTETCQRCGLTVRRTK